MGLTPRLGALGALSAVAAVAMVLACGSPPVVEVDHRGMAGVPVPRTDASSAYDAANGTIVMFGGAARDGVLDETWTWDGVVWRRQHPAHSPSPREFALMAFEPASRHVLLFGGLACPPPKPDDTLGCDYVATSTRLSDTWSWDGTDWSQVVTAHSPDVFAFAPLMAGAGTDTAHGRLIVLSFVKIVLGNEGLAMWTFDGGDWRQLHPKHSPPDAEFGGPAFDSASGRLLVQQSSGPHVDCGTGGPCQRMPPYNMTWAWNGSDWIDLGPQVRTPHDYGVLVSTGNAGLMLIENGSMHLWNGEAWGDRRAVAWTDPLRTGLIAAFDQASNELVIFGGRYWGTNHLFGDTFAWNGSAWSTPVAALPSPSLALAECLPSTAQTGQGWEMAQDVPDSAISELGFAEPHAGPCHLDVIVHFSLTGHDGRLLPIPGNPSQVEISADLTFDVGTEYATFTLTHACELPAGAIATWSTADFTVSDPAIFGSCQSAGPMTLTPGTLNRPAAK